MVIKKVFVFLIVEKVNEIFKEKKSKNEIKIRHNKRIKILFKYK